MAGGQYKWRRERRSILTVVQNETRKEIKQKEREDRRSAGNKEFRKGIRYRGRFERLKRWCPDYNML